MIPCTTCTLKENIDNYSFGDSASSPNGFTIIVSFYAKFRTQNQMLFKVLLLGPFCYNELYCTEQAIGM